MRTQDGNSGSERTWGTERTGGAERTGGTQRTGGAQGSGGPAAAVPRARRVGLLAGVAGVATVAVVGVLLATGRIGAGGEQDALALSLPDAGAVSASCLEFTVDHLAGMSPAFAGTAIDVTDDRVVLRVDRWYAGGDAAEAVLDYPVGAQVALNGVIDFREGGQYLITAEGGTVNLCGYSGEATPQLQAAFEAAF